MSDNSTEAYLSMVRKLSKPGEAIIAQLTPDNAHLLHVCGGLMDETSRELRLAILSEEQADILEEGGDCRYYLQAIYMIAARCLGVSEALPIIRAADTRPLDGNADHLFHVTVQAGHLWDLIKRPALMGSYPKDKLTGVQLTKETWARLVCARCIVYHRHLVLLLDEHGLTDVDCIEANMRKLVLGPKARFAEGSYTDEAYRERRDKLSEKDDTQV